MPHGEMQLIAYGAQDIYLTGNPSITFFKFVYKKHTNFATEYIRKDFESIPNFNTDNHTKVRCKIDRNGDLISDIYLVYDLPDIYSTPKTSISSSTITVGENGEYFRWVNNLGENIIHKVELLFDGHLIDTQYGLWMNIWNELTIPKSKRHAYNTMIGNISSCTNPSLYHGSYIGKPSDSTNLPSINARRLYIPLPFWFCLNPGLSIPLVALQYNEIYINIELNKMNDLFTVGNPPVSPQTIFDLEYLNNFGNNSYTDLTTHNKLLRSNLISNGFSSSNLFWKFVNNTTDNSASWIQNCYLDINYIFLDKDERTKYAQINHEYLIHQVQQRHFNLNNVSENIKGSINILNLKFHHPVKELVWVLRRNDAYKRNQWNNYTTSIYNFDYHDSDNNFSDKFQKQSTVSAISNTNSYHHNKIIYSLNYLNGKENGFTGLGKTDGPIDNYYDLNDYYNLNSDSFNDVNNIMYHAKLMFNGNDRFSAKDNIFFNYLQPYKYHTTTPSPGVNVYSFALNPEDNQPSGTCNMSRINDVQLELGLRWFRADASSDLDSSIYEGYECYVFALNYNVLKILGGMGGLVFSN